MPSRQDGNAAKRLVDSSPPPWASWPKGMTRHARAMWFIEGERNAKGHVTAAHPGFLKPMKGWGAGKPMRLGDFQREWIEEIYSDDTSIAIRAIPKGNGKSTLLAGLALHALYDEDEDGGAPQVPVIATTISQVCKTIYDPAIMMVQENPELILRSLVYSGMGTQRLAFPYNRGELFPKSNDPDGLQGLDPSFGVCDEMGFMPIDSWESLMLAVGKRPRTLIIGIGTPGFDHENALWFVRDRFLSGVEMEGFSYSEYMADPNCELRDEEQWRKANPAIGAGFMTVKHLRQLCDASTETQFRILRMGQWIEGGASWLGTDGRTVWRALTDPWEMIEGAPTWVGVDIGRKQDSTAIAWAQRRPDGRMHVKARIWHPRPDGKLDVADAMQFIRDLDAAYDLQSVAFDPRLFDLPAQQLDDEGLPMVEFPQSLERMTPAVGAAFQAIKRGEMSHDEDQAFETQVLHGIARYNERGFTLARSRDANKIDAAVAMCICLHDALVKPAPKKRALVGFG